MIVGLCYMLLVSFMSDLPEESENWSEIPEFKNGPITRVALIVLYTIIVYIIYRDQHSLINFKDGESNILLRAKIKYYLYNFSIVVFAAYILTHDTMEPPIIRKFPDAGQELQRQEKSQN
jgi:hypothetical protein